MQIVKIEEKKREEEVRDYNNLLYPASVNCDVCVEVERKIEHLNFEHYKIASIKERRELRGG